MSSDEFDPRFDAAFQPGLAGKPAKAPKRSANPAKAALQSLREHPETLPVVVAETDAEPEPKHRLNPFLIALSVLSVVLIGASIYGLQLRTELNQFSFTGLQQDLERYFLLEAVVSLVPWCFTLGVAIIIGILFAEATAWRRKA